MVGEGDPVSAESLRHGIGYFALEIVYAHKRRDRIVRFYSVFPGDLQGRFALPKGERFLDAPVRLDEIGLDLPFRKGLSGDISEFFRSQEEKPAVRIDSLCLAEILFHLPYCSVQSLK